MVILFCIQQQQLVPLSAGFVINKVTLCRVRSVSTMSVKCACVNVTDALECSAHSAQQSTMTITKTVLYV